MPHYGFNFQWMFSSWQTDRPWPPDEKALDFLVAHHGTWWWEGHATASAPEYLGVVWEGRTWKRDTLREFYQPWRDLEAQGASLAVIIRRRTTSLCAG